MKRFLIRSNDEDDSSSSSDEGEFTKKDGGNKRIKGLSSVWKYFTRSSDKKLAKCLTCHKEYKTSGNTSNLHDHLKRMHPNIDKDDDSLPSSSNSSSVISSMRPIDYHFKRAQEYDPTSSRKKEIDYALAMLIGVDLQPFSIVNDEGFRNYTKVLDPKYVLPSKNTLKNVNVENMYKECQSKLRAMLVHVEYLAITTDCWTSASMESYITVTCQFIDEEFNMRTAVLSTKQLNETTNHSAENIAESLHDIFVDYDIFFKITYIVTDNAANMIKACEILNKSHFPCFAHTLNLVVQDSMLKGKGSEELRPLLQRCKAIVTFIKKSANATEQFKMAQMRETPLKILQDVVTRWNSSYLMIKRILETKDAISTVLMANRKAPEPFSEIEIITLTHIEKILSFFYTITERCSGNGVTLSLIIPLVNGLHRNLCNLEANIDNGPALGLCKSLKNGVLQRLLPYETRPPTQLATLLDPRFKKKAFILARNADSAVLLLDSEINTISPTESQIRPEYVHQPSGESTGDPLFNFLEVGNDVVTSSVADNIIIRSQYLERPSLIQSANILEFWKSSKNEFLILRKASLKYLSIPASSTESERTFSKCGTVTADKRNRIKPKNVDKVISINKNIRLIK